MYSIYLKYGWTSLTNLIKIASSLFEIRRFPKPCGLVFFEIFKTINGVHNCIAVVKVIKRHMECATFGVCT